MAIRFGNTAGMNSRVRKLDDKAVKDIRRKKGKATAKSLAKKYKIHTETIHKIWRRDAWAHLPD